MRRKLLIALSALALLGLAGFGWLWAAPCWMGGCAPVDDLGKFQAEGSELLDIHGKPFGILATVNRRVVPLDSLPDFLPRAFLAVEDRRFYDHSGVDFTRVGGAMVSNVKAGGVAEGGSTITMQLARNLFPDRLPSSQRSFKRKLLEIRVARQLERSFDKEKILELYLNHIYLGSGAYGVEAAAQEYFGKPASQLGVAEAAVLAALPKAPSTLNPKENREGARERRDLVLTEMAKAGFITEQQAAEAREQPVKLARSRKGAAGERGGYFIEQVRRELEEQVGDQFYTAGLKIHTTFDPAAQAAAEEELARQLDAIEAGRFGRFRHRAAYPESREVAEETGETPYLQGAVVVMDARSGEVRALVGGRDFDDSKFNRALQAKRQAGSAYKPFIYLAALERYRSPVHVVEDAPVRVTLARNQVWEPKNYTGRYDGPMTLRDALARSKNTVTVRLAMDVGMDQVNDLAHALGISGDLPTNPAAALGVAEVSPIELTAAYAALDNGGRRTTPHLVRRVEDREGLVVWEPELAEERAVAPEAAFVLTTMLRDVVDRGTGTAVRAAGFAGPAAGKTGTTNDATDVWYVGYTPDLVATVWMGFDDPAPIVAGASGGTLAAPVWGRMMRRIYAGRRMPAAWSPPAGVATAEVERATGVVVDASCPARGATYTEYFIGGGPPVRNCTPQLPPTMLAGADTGWVDEEWGLEPLPGDSILASGEVAEGVYWPELEAQRQRGDTLPPVTGAPTATPPTTGAPAAPPRPRDTAPAPPAAPPRAEPAPAPPREEPKLLGRPTSEPAPPDTSSGG